MAKILKICNAYAGIGGNRKLWPDKVMVNGEELELHITAVELDPKIAKIYQDFFPQDKVIVADAHQYLLEHFGEYEFIWSSPPCPSHSICNNFLHAQGVIRYPDMSLWQEIVFLQRFFKGKWVVENVKSYYPPLWPPTELDRHYFWANFAIRGFKVVRNFNINNARACSRQTPKKDLENLKNFHDIKITYDIKNIRQMLRNAVYPPLGLHILNESQRNIQPELFSNNEANK